MKSFECESSSEGDEPALHSISRTIAEPPQWLRANTAPDWGWHTAVSECFLFSKVLLEFVLIFCQLFVRNFKKSSNLILWLFNKWWQFIWSPLLSHCNFCVPSRHWSGSGKFLRILQKLANWKIRHIQIIISCSLIWKTILSGTSRSLLNK